jgi:hypothetical protein
MAASGDLSIVLDAPAVALSGTYTGTSPTDTTNALNGVIFGGGGYLTWTPAVAAPPATLVLAVKVDKAVALPTPTMVDGRPT